MKTGDIVAHNYWGKGMIIKQQGVVDRWLVRWFETISSIGDDKSVRSVWGSDLEVISESR